jgi:hypothetical protein
VRPIALVRTRLIDKVVEEFYPKVGGSEGYTKIEHLEKRERYKQELNELRNRARIAFANCASLLRDNTLIEQPDFIFEAVRREARPQQRDEIIKELVTRKNLVRDMYNGLSDSQRAREMVETAVGFVEKATESVGPYGKIVLYSLVTGQLDREARKAYPKSDLFVSLMIKNILKSEKYPKIRTTAWRRAGIAERDTLRFRDITVFDPRGKEATDNRRF